MKVKKEVSRPGTVKARVQEAGTGPVRAGHDGINTVARDVGLKESRLYN